MAHARKAAPTSSKELSQLRLRLEELEETLKAIRAGQVDAVLVSGPKGDRIFTLQGSEHPYRVLVEAMNEGAATLSTQGIILFANPRLAEMLGCPLQRLLGSSLTRFTKNIQCPSFEKLLLQIEDGPQKVQASLRLSGRRYLPVYLSFSPLREEGLQGICLIVTDLSEQKAKEQQLAQTNQALLNEVAQRVRAEEALRRDEESLRQLSGRLLQLQDEERRRIARDLHDSTGQKVAGLALDIALLQQNAAQLSPQAQSALQSCANLAKEITTDLRTLSYLLHPPLLDEVGLRSAVQWYVDGFVRRSRIRVDLSLPPKLARMPEDVEIALFRILQESLSNVHRHSGSATASVRMIVEDHRVVLEIKDCGQPTLPDAIRTVSQAPELLGVGIRGMRERVRQLGGQLEIVHTPKGTTVKATLPLKTTPAARPTDALLAG